MANYGKMAKEAAAEEKLIFTNPSMKKLRELRFGYTDWKHYNHISKEMLEQYNFNEYKKADITKVYNYTTKLLEDYEKEIDEKFAMELAKDNYYHNIPKEWITEKVWAVLLKNPVYKDYVNKNLQKDAEISKRTYTPKETETAQENDAPSTIEEIPIPTIANETANCTSNANETNVNKNLPKKSPKTVAKLKKNNYINTTNETKTTKTTKTGDNSMMNNKEIAKIAPIAVKKILATQIVNKTDTKKTYWGGWAKVRAGMNATYNDYNKFQELENQWAELRNSLGKGPKGHFCWSLINKNRVGIKQEPNSTLRFIKNVKIRIAMAKDVLNGKYTETQINDYMNGLSQNYKIKYGLI